MARRVNYGGASINIPGAYSTTDTNLVGATPVIPTGRVAILGEASKGEPAVVQEFTSQQLQDLVNEYGSGPIVEAARALFNPSNDARIRQGAQRLFVYKTNASTQASLSLATGWGTLTDQNYGSEGNLIYSILDIDAESFTAVESDTIADPTFNSGADLSGNTLTVRVNGEALRTFTFSAIDGDHDTLTEVVNDLNSEVTGSWDTAPGLVFAAVGSDKISVTHSAASNEHREGRGRSFQIVGGTARSALELDSAALDDTLIIADSENDMRIRMARQIDNVSEDSDDNTGDIGGSIYLQIGCEDTTCTVTIDSTSFQTSAATATDLNLSFDNYPTLNDLAEYINSQTSYVCQVPSNINGGLSPAVLDRVSNLGIAYSKTSDDKYPGRIKADAYEVNQWFTNYSSLVSSTRTSYKGLPDSLTQTYLSGGARGSSANSNFTAGLTAMEAEEFDIIVPLVSQDASDDIVEDAAYTDSSSTYTAESILLATKNHCKSMSSVINRKERVSYLGFRGTFEECQNEALTLNSEFSSLLFQDVQVVNTDGDLEWMQPHILACIAAGMQAGGETGQPTTRKYINANGIRHVKKQGVDPNATEEFDPRTESSIAIDKGLMPVVAPSSGGIRIVRQLTTYTQSDNFAWIAPNVIEAAHFVAKTLREALESIFVGEKAKTGTAGDIEAVVMATMSDMLTQDIIVGDDTNEGLGYKNLSVYIEGNTAYVDITITPVQGVDFILNRITLDNIRQSA